MNMPKMELNLQNILNSLILILCLGVSVLLGFFVAWPQYTAYQAAQPVLVEKQMKNDQLDAFVKYLQNLSDFQEKLFANMGLSKQAIPEAEETPFFLDQLIQVAAASNVVIDTLTFGGLGTSTSTSNSTFTRFQPNEGEVISNASDTPQVDEFLNNNVPGLGGASGAEVSLPLTIPPEEFSVRATFMGSYNTITDFLLKLEGARRLTEVKEIEVEQIFYTEKGSEDESAVAYLNTLNAAGIPNDASVYEVTLLVTGYYMKDPEISVVGPEILNSQRNLESFVSEIEALTYYEPQSIEEIELNLGRLNPFEEEEETTVTSVVTQTETDSASVAGN